MSILHRNVTFVLFTKTSDVLIMLTRIRVFLFQDSQPPTVEAGRIEYRIFNGAPCQNMRVEFTDGHIIPEIPNVGVCKILLF